MESRPLMESRECIIFFVLLISRFLLYMLPTYKERVRNMLYFCGLIFILAIFNSYYVFLTAGCDNDFITNIVHIGFSIFSRSNPAQKFTPTDCMQWILEYRFGLNLIQTYKIEIDL